MNTDQSAAMFRALGDPTRLAIFQFLLRQCCDVALAEDGSVAPVNGVTIGEVCCQVTGADHVTSTLSHHVKELRLAGLVDVTRNGRFMVCRANVAALEALQTSLQVPNSSKEVDNDCC